MSRSGAARRSGDPRKRAAVGGERGGPPADRGTRRRVLVLVAAAAAVGVGALVLTLRPAGSGVDEEASAHARTACELTATAEEAASVDTDARYAAAALLLDKAVIESERAAGLDDEFDDLDRAVQAVHTAAHRGDRGPWRTSLDVAVASCGGWFR